MPVSLEDLNFLQKQLEEKTLSSEQCADFLKFSHYRRSVASDVLNEERNAWDESFAQIIHKTNNV